MNSRSSTEPGIAHVNSKKLLAGKAMVAACLLAMSMAGTDLRAGQNTAMEGVLRSTGDAHLQALLERWQKVFAEKHPKAIFRNNLKGNASAIYGLETRQSDIALMSRALYPFERYGTYERSWIYPVAIEVATGSAHASNRAAAQVILVHKDNPVKGFTLDQLDRIFGAQRTGGWKGLEWDTSAARDSGSSIRTWRQVGVSGELGDRSINTYGPALLGPGAVTAFQSKVMHGGAIWNENYREYASMDTLTADLSKDRQGIGYGAQDLVGSKPLKVVGVAASASAPFVMPSAASVSNRSYPLSQPIYLYYTIDTQSGDPGSADPLVSEFVRFILSTEGQALVSADTGYYPLTSELVSNQLQKLESKAWPAERPKP